jgi:glycosyltransferase involved in cell wall biosynthesis
MPDKKKLILLTDSFPFDVFEPYLVNEFEYLAKSFEKIFIFSASPKTIPLWKLPANVVIYNCYIDLNFYLKIKAVLLFNAGIFNTEKKFVNSIMQQKFDLTKIKIMILEYFKGKIQKKYIEKVMHEELKNPSNLLLYSYWSDNKAIAAALLKKEFPALKVISRAHGWDVYFERNTSAYIPLRTFIFDNIDKVFFVSENGKEYTSKKYKDPSKLAVSYLGTNQSTEPRFNKKRNPFHIVSCSSLIPLKRVELIIKAIAALPDHIEIRWTHFGTGILDKESINLAEKFLSALSNIHFEFKGQVDNSEVLQFYVCNDVNLLVNTSSTEGLPMTMMEAMSCGIPVMGTNVGGVSEIVINDFNGCLLSPNPTPAEISDKIQMFIDMDKERYSQFSMNAYETWNTKFNAAINFPAFLKEVL